MTRVTFPPEFLFGTATAAYQIEGGSASGGRAPSIWDTFCSEPGRVTDGANGDTACDHYHRFGEDIALMGELGMQCYRLSLSWSRIVPTGDGPVNEEGIAFYREILSALRAHGIRSYVTLHHWDLPQDLENHGGWRNRATASAFGRYAAIVAARLADLVDAWIPINEPYCIAYLGHQLGVHAPGLHDLAATLRVIHHLNLGHGLAVRSLRMHSQAPIGTALNLMVCLPEVDDEPHREAARLIELVSNEVWLGPIFDAEYGQELRSLTEPWSDWSYVLDGDLELASAPLDFVGINYYNPTVVTPERTAMTGPGSSWMATFGTERHIGSLRTAMGWGIHPDSLRALIVATHRRTGLPVLVTENGTATEETIDPAGDEVIIDDVDRIRFLHDHLEAVHAAMTDGVPLLGYCSWSFMDNFEWAQGYRPRFGMVHVDYASGRRIPKASASWYARVIAEHALPVDKPAYRDFVTAETTRTHPQ